MLVTVNQINNKRQSDNKQFQKVIRNVIPQFFLAQISFKEQELSIGRYQPVFAWDILGFIER